MLLLQNIWSLRCVRILVGSRYRVGSDTFTVSQERALDQYHRRPPTSRESGQTTYKRFYLRVRVYLRKLLAMDGGRGASV